MKVVMKEEQLKNEAAVYLISFYLPERLADNLVELIIMLGKISTVM